VTQGETIAAVRDRKRRGLKMNAEAVRSDSHLLYWATFRLMGGWEKAMGLAGLPSERARGGIATKYPRKSDVIREIRRRRKVGKPIHSSGVITSEDRDSGLHTRARKLFGSWRKAVEAAGFDYRRVSDPHRAPYRTENDVVRAIRKRCRRGIPSSSTAAQRGPKPDQALYKAAKRIFGGWQKAVDAAGINRH